MDTLENIEKLYSEDSSANPSPQKLQYRKGYKPTLTRITPEQAEKYIPLDEDQYGNEPKFFTMEKNPEDPDWDIITYYTNRSRRPVDISPEFNINDATWVYVLSNPSMPGMVKIGMTDRTIAERKAELDRASGIPTPFTIEYGFPCINAGRLEKEIHMYLEVQGLRANNDREFFYLHPESAIAIVNKLGEPYRINIT